MKKENKKGEMPDLFLFEIKYLDIYKHLKVFGTSLVLKQAKLNGTGNKVTFEQEEKEEWKPLRMVDTLMQLDE